MARGALTNWLRPNDLARVPTTSSTCAPDDVFSPRAPSIAFRPFALQPDAIADGTPVLAAAMALPPGLMVAQQDTLDDFHLESVDGYDVPLAVPEPAGHDYEHILDVVQDIFGEAAAQVKFGYSGDDRLDKLKRELKEPCEFAPGTLASDIWQGAPDVAMIQHIGGGGFGAVFLVDVRDNDGEYRERVLKVSVNDGDAITGGWGKEVGCLSILSGVRGVIGLDGYTSGPDYCFLLLEAGSSSLDAYIRGPDDLGEGELLFIAHRLAASLADMHNRDVVHRDLKPDNVVLCAAEHATELENDLLGAQEPKYIDFGLADLMCLEPEGRAGTVGYLAPEVFHASEVGFPGDIWGLGCILFELVERKTIQQVVWDTAEEENRPRLHDLNTYGRVAAEGPTPAWFQHPDWNSDAGGVLRELVDSCFEPDPAQRITADELAFWLGKALGMWLDDNAPVDTEPGLLAPPGVTAPSSTASPSPKPSPLAPPEAELAPTTAPTTLSHTESSVEVDSLPRRPNAPEPPSSKSKSASSIEIVDVAPEPRPAPRPIPPQPPRAGSEGDVLTFWADLDIERLVLATSRKGPTVRFGELPVPDRDDKRKAKAKGKLSWGKLKTMMGKMGGWVRKMVR